MAEQIFDISEGDIGEIFCIKHDNTSLEANFKLVFYL
jgi:hypothetical protein